MFAPPALLVDTAGQKASVDDPSLPDKKTCGIGAEVDRRSDKLFGAPKRPIAVRISSSRPRDLLSTIWRGTSRRRVPIGLLCVPLGAKMSVNSLPRLQVTASF